MGQSAGDDSRSKISAKRLSAPQRSRVVEWAASSQRRSGDQGNNEDTFACFLTRQRADKVLNFRPADAGLPSLRLNVNHIEAQSVFVNYAIYAFIARYNRRDSRQCKSLRC
jgi:hypothetical protein